MKNSQSYRSKSKSDSSTHGWYISLTVKVVLRIVSQVPAITEYIPKFPFHNINTDIRKITFTQNSSYGPTVRPIDCHAEGIWFESKIFGVMYVLNYN